MDLEQLMRELARAGATAIIKADHERFAEGGEYWTLVISGSALGEQGFVRSEEATLEECLKIGLSRLRDLGNQWEWVSGFGSN